LQTTLLGISVAIILALLTALVGPHFVDWNAHRATFEAEASKLVGQPVRIGGDIDVRLLPTPAIALGNIEIGSAATPQMRARELHAELALGALMRGEFRTSEVRIAGPAISAALGGDGRLEWPAKRLGFEPDRLQIEKVEVEDGRIDFADAASGVQGALTGFWFKGDVRSLLGPVKGEGGFISAGERYGYDGTVRVKLSLDPSDHPIALEADGALRLEENAPRFDGTLSATRPAVMGRREGPGAAAVPWRVNAKVKASPANAVFEQLEYQYGPDERAVRLAGTGELRFGKNPLFETVLSARQVDIDRVLPDGAGRLPLSAVKALIEPLAEAYRPLFPIKLSVGIDAVTLASGTLQSLRGDFRLDGGNWDIDSLEFRAPGFAQVRLGGRIAHTPDGVTFRGPTRIESSNPRALLAWLEGRTEAVQVPSGLMRASGDFTVGTQEVAIEALKFEFDRKQIEGRIAYSAAAGAKPPRVDAELKAAELDVDGVLAFARTAMDGTAFERPRAGSLTVDIGRATVAGIDVRGIGGTLKLDPEGLTFDRVRIADLADAAFSLNGRMEGALDAPRGTVTFDIDARGLDGTAAVLDKYWPQAAAPVRQAAAKVTPLKTKVTLGIEPLSATDAGGASRVKLALEGTGGALRMKVGAEAAGEIGTLVFPDFLLDAHVTAIDGSALAALTGLDRALAVDKRAGTLSVTVRGKSGADAQIDARLAAGGLTATAKGTARPFAGAGTSAALDLTLQAADAGPLRRGAAARNTALLPVALRARLNASGNEIALDGINGAVGGQPLRGKLKLIDWERIEGQIDTDAADIPALLAIATGLPRARSEAVTWSGDPFEDNGTRALNGRVNFAAARASLSPSLIARQMRGVLRLGPNEVAFDDVEGVLAGGRAKASFTLRRASEGLEARGLISLTGADAAALLAGEGRPAITGLVGIQLEYEGSGLSPASLIGSLRGTGLITLENAQLSALDPKAFRAAIRATDQSAALDAAKIRDVVATVLDGGSLAVPRLDAPVTINAGQARIGPTIALGQGADLTIAASSDLSEISLDARLTLTGPVIEGTSVRPDVLVLLKGPLVAPRRTVDVSALSGFLMLRAVELQSRQIDSIEQERRDAERREARETERREAERRDAERAMNETGSVPPTTSSALPAPPEDTAPGIPSRVGKPRAVPTQPLPRPSANADRAPPLPPPLHIGPAPGAAPRPAAAAKSAQQPPAPRSALDILFGVQR
jgi:uncharacterized protein involved in outer membrane biogenesis